MGSRPSLIIFARAPRPGRTKTRLIPLLGPPRTADLYRCFRTDTFLRACRAEADITVAVADAEDVDAVGACASPFCPGARVTVQSDGDLGARMADALQRAFARGEAPAALIGTDSPDLPADRIDQAFSLSRTHDVVLGPCLDGGYYLIAMARLVSGVFEGVEWSSENVLADTLERVGRQGATSALLDPWYDVDTPDDLIALQQRLRALHRAGKEIPCQHTWDFLRDMDLERQGA